MSDGFMIVGEENVKKARILTLRSMLKLEVKGLKVSRGRTAYTIIKEEFGFKGNKEKVLEQLSAYINEHILPDNKHCPECGEEINPAAMMASGCSEKKRQALIANAKKPRPNRKKGVKREAAKTMTVRKYAGMFCIMDGKKELERFYTLPQALAWCKENNIHIASQSILKAGE